MSADAKLMMEGIDRRQPEQEMAVDERRTLRHDPSVCFEEYVYWAEITRAEEKLAHERHTAAQGPTTFMSILKSRFSRGVVYETESPAAGNFSGTEKAGEAGEAPTVGHGMEVSSAEWKRASRAIRTAGWSSVFFLITTDILGPFSVPWAFAQMGYGPGIALYTVFGFLACYSGFQLWTVYIHLDSDRYPALGYGDLFYRVIGSWARHSINVLQSVQQLLTVSILILSNGQSIAQIAKGSDGTGNLCFIASLIIFMAAGMILSQIRTLQRFGWLANAAVWINVTILCLTMGVAANSPPNFAATEASFGPNFAEGPIYKYAGTPPDGMASGGSGFVGSLNGLNQAVYSYAGALLFVAFMAEMRHPFDFWKGMICAQAFIYVVYMFFGLFVYSYQGQFAFNPAMQGLSPYNYQTAGNIMNIITGLIAAALYGNIGLKVVYTEVFMELFHFPSLVKTSGKFWWAIMAPLYWIIAFIIGAAIPQFSFISGLVGALLLLNFTYTFPAILALAYQVQKDAMTPEEHFDLTTRTYNRIDTGFKRILRGFLVKWPLNTWNIIYATGALATVALGSYSSILGLISAFSIGGSASTSFGCTPPV